MGVRGPEVAALLAGSKMRGRTFLQAIFMNPPCRKPVPSCCVGMRRQLRVYAPNKEAFSRLSLFITDNLHPPSHTYAKPPSPGSPPEGSFWIPPHLV